MGEEVSVCKFMGRAQGSGLGVSLKYPLHGTRRLLRSSAPGVTIQRSGVRGEDSGFRG